MDFVIQLLRGVFYSLDSIVFGLIPSVYALLIQITRTSIFSQSEINVFAKRIYAFIGVFMLFKVTVSIINYILNPDDFVDKEKGFTNVIKRIILSLIMLVLAPYVFNEAYKLQGYILEENTIMNVVFGTPADPQTPGRDTNTNNGRSSNSSYVDMAGRKMQFTLMYAFAQPNYQEFSGSEFNLMDCENSYDKDEDGNYIFRDSSVTKSGKSSYIYQLNPKCWGTYDADNDKYVNDGTNGQLMQLFKKADAENAYQNYAQGVAQQSFSLFFRKDVVTAKDSSGRYLVNYRYGISTAIGVATLYLFLMFCIDIAVRSIQWGFLQMISPIPILSYCDPKSGKDGMFKKWLDKCKKVYLDLFIRLFALYFGIYIITLVGTFRDVITGEEISMMDNWILSIFMILGVLMFVKKLPEFLKETLALDGSGMFKGYMNPFKKIEDEAVGGKLIGGTAKKAVGAVGGAVAGIGAGALTGKGMLAGMKAGIQGGMKGDKFGKNWSNAYSAGKEKSAQIDERRADGVSGLDVLGEKAHNAMPWHGQTRTERVKAVSATYKAVQDAYSSYAASLAGTDAIAKEMDRRIKAAHEAGDFAQETRWTNAFDARLKQVAQNGGKISFGTALPTGTTLEDFINANGEFEDKKRTGAKSLNDLMDPSSDKLTVNEALNNYANRMDSLIKHLNKTASDVAGFSKIDETLVSSGNLKTAMGKSKGVQSDIDSNRENLHMQDVAKYAGGKKNK